MVSRKQKVVGNKMKILVTGGGGQLGSAVVKALIRRGEQVYAPYSKEMDITDRDSVVRAFRRFSPDGVIHCAAYTDVDKAEGDSLRAYLVNTKGTACLAELCREAGAKMLYVSTDYVFDGSGTRFWRPEDRCAPLNVYGWSKYEGELAVKSRMDACFVVRTSWVFGPGGNHFVNTMLRIGAARDAVQVVCDQVGSPSHTGDLAELFAEIIRTEKYGYYHAANEGVCSRYELAQEIFSQAERLGHKEYGPARLQVTPILTTEFPTKARRPLNSRLDTGKLQSAGFDGLPSWRDAVGRYLRESGY